LNESEGRFPVSKLSLFGSFPCVLHLSYCVFGEELIELYSSRTSSEEN